MKRWLLSVMVVMVLGVPAGWEMGASQAPGVERVLRMSLLVKDQQEALRWYTEVLGFVKRADDRSRPGFWWLTVSPPRQPDFELVLLQADGPRLALVGTQPTAVLETRDCRAMYERLKAAGVEFPAPPSDTAWGVSAVFVDLYGNTYNLLEPRRSGAAGR